MSASEVSLPDDKQEYSPEPKVESKETLNKEKEAVNDDYDDEMPPEDVAEPDIDGPEVVKPAIVPQSSPNQTLPPKVEEPIQSEEKKEEFKIEMQPQTPIVE